MKNRMNLFKASALGLALAAAISCSTTSEKKDTAQHEVKGDPAAASELFLRVKEINENSPSTISSSFTADGINNGQKFKIEGTADFDRQGYYKISVVDYVFRSKVLDAYRDMDILYFSYPAEKKLLVDNVNRINLYRYIGFQTDFIMLYTLFTGGIPLVRDGRVTKCVAGDEPESYNLVLENDEYMQNIHFVKKVPDKIMIISKATKDKMEIYLKSQITKDKSIFYKNIRIVAPEKNLSVNIKFSGTKLNGSLKIEKFRPDKLKKEVEVIKIN